MTGEVVSPHGPVEAGERRGGDHVDLAGVGIVLLRPVVGDDAFQHRVHGLSHRARRELQDRDVADSARARVPVSVAVVIEGTYRSVDDISTVHW